MDDKPPSVIEVGEQDFQQSVLARSRTVPVVVDFWAPWCGPCRVLGPVLERLAEESKGAFVLAKLNTDENPLLSEAYGIRGIPAVMAFRNGQVVSEFVGAVPESAVREFIQAILPTEADRLASEARRQRAAGRTEDAERTLQSALDVDADHEGALIELARIRIEQGRDDDALQILNRVPPGDAREEADRMSAEIRLRRSGQGNIPVLRARLADHPNDLEARLALARALAAAGEHEEALQQFLDVVKREDKPHDGAGRQGMLDLFQLLGPDHLLTDRYRKELGRVLFA